MVKNTRTITDKIMGGEMTKLSIAPTDAQVAEIQEAIVGDAEYLEWIEMVRCRHTRRPFTNATRPSPFLPVLPPPPLRPSTLQTAPPASHAPLPSSANRLRPSRQVGDVPEATLEENLRNVFDLATRAIAAFGATTGSAPALPLGAADTAEVSQLVSSLDLTYVPAQDIAFTPFFGDASRRVSLGGLIDSPIKTCSPTVNATVGAFISAEQMASASARAVKFDVPLETAAKIFKAGVAFAAATPARAQVRRRLCRLFDPSPP